MDFPKLRVLIDSHNLALPHGTGIKTYGLTLLAALRRLGVQPDLLASAKWHSDPMVARAQLYDIPLKPGEGISPFVESWRNRLGRARIAEYLPPADKSNWPIPDDFFPYGCGCSILPLVYEYAQWVHELHSLPARFRTRKPYDVWHATNPMMLRAEGMRTITTIHDLIPLSHPYTCPINRVTFAEQVRFAIKESRAIAAVSEHTKEDLLTHFDAPEDKIIVTHQPTLYEKWAGTEHHREGVLRQFDLQRQGYILFVGNLEPKKNVGRLLRAYLALDCDLPLVIVGRKAWMWKEDFAALLPHVRSAARKVRLLGYVPPESLPYLYESAYCFVFPSLCEGFGLPPLEAMTLGCPVVCSNVPSLKEVGGDGVEYVEALEVESIAQGMEHLLNNRSRRDELAAKGRKQALRFSFESYVGKIRRLYEKALS